MDKTTVNSSMFGQQSRIIWKQVIQLNDGFVDLDMNSMQRLMHKTYSVEKIELGNYALSAFILAMCIFWLLFFYVCFFKWVAKGNLDLPTFGGASQVVFKCFPQRNGLKKTESSNNLQDISDDLVVQYDNTIEKEDD